MNISVLTKNQACKKFAKKLDFTVPSKRTGNHYHPVFWFLKLDKRCFSHKSVTPYCENPQKSEYYLYPDLEAKALEHGWKPRGKMKDQVPWKRKDTVAQQIPNTPNVENENSSNDEVGVKVLKRKSVEEVINEMFQIAEGKGQVITIDSDEETSIYCSRGMKKSRREKYK